MVFVAEHGVAAQDAVLQGIESHAFVARKVGQRMLLDGRCYPQDSAPLNR